MSVSVTQTCRDIDELLPVAQTAIKLFFQECHKEGIAIFITETWRSQERQNYLYAQGRTRAGQIVTWTLSSNHKSRLAWDIGASQLNGNSDIYNMNIIKKAGSIAMKLGITWGGQPSWVLAGKSDAPHFEVSKNWTIPKGYKLEGVVSIPTSSKGRITMVSDVTKLPKVELSVADSKNKELTPETLSERNVSDLEFTSKTLRESLEKRISSPATAKLLDEYAVKVLGHKSKLKNGRLSEGDLLSVGIELAVHFAKLEEEK